MAQTTTILRWNRKSEVTTTRQRQRGRFRQHGRFCRQPSARQVESTLKRSDSNRSTTTTTTTTTMTTTNDERRRRRQRRTTNDNTTPTANAKRRSAFGVSFKFESPRTHFKDHQPPTTQRQPPSIRPSVRSSVLPSNSSLAEHDFVVQACTSTAVQAVPFTEEDEVVGRGSWVMSWDAQHDGDGGQVRNVDDDQLIVKQRQHDNDGGPSRCKEEWPGVLECAVEGCPWSLRAFVCAWIAEVKVDGREMLMAVGQQSPREPDVRHASKCRGICLKVSRVSNETLKKSPAKLPQQNLLRWERK